MRQSISGKVVLITGPARGIGEATARLLAARGARLSLVGMEPARLASLAAELGGGHAWFECDVTDQAALDRAVAGTIGKLGAIDVVVANAGIASNGTVAVTPVAALARTVEVNLIGVMRTVSATLPHVTASKGYYLLVSSAAALAALPGLAAYAASKAGVEFFGNALRLESTPTWCATRSETCRASTRCCARFPARSDPTPRWKRARRPSRRGSSGGVGRCSCRNRSPRSRRCGRSS
jgi:NADP-dependent 3-hydroxy acid dehydrogenase YdfG